MWSNAGRRDDAANTSTVDLGAAHSGLPSHPDPLTHAGASRRIEPTTRAHLLTRQFDLHICRLHDRDSRHARLEVEVVCRVAGDEGDETVGAGLDLHLATTLSLTTRVTMPGNRLRADCLTAASRLSWRAGLATAARDSPSISRWPPEVRTATRRPSSTMRRTVSTLTPSVLAACPGL